MSRRDSTIGAILTFAGAIFVFYALMICTLIAAFAGYITHIIYVIGLVTSEIVMTTNQVVLAIVGTIAPPVGAIHGVGLWFGLW